MCRTCQIMRQWSDIDSKFLDLLFQFYLSPFAKFSPFAKCPKPVNSISRRLKRALF